MIKTNTKCFFVKVQVFSLSSFLFCQQVIWNLEDFRAFVCFLFSPPILIGLFTLFGTPWAKGGVLARI